MTRLRSNQLCPIHKRLNCCGRSTVQAISRSKPKFREIQPGVRLFPDGHIERSPAALKRQKDYLLRQGKPCEACKVEFSDHTDVELSHFEPKGMNGWKRDDSDSNLFLLHTETNRDQGSRSWSDYVKLMKGKKYPCQKRA